MRLLARMAASAAFVFFIAIPAQADAPLIERFTLANGLEVVVIPNHRVPAVSHMLWYRIGAGDDPEGKSGLAHFHEHVMFLGTAKRKSGEYSDIIARHGGQENAFTGADATSYYINISKQELPLAMELEADRMQALTATEDNVARERQVIIEERRQRIENNPEALLAEQVNAALFRHHPYHTPVIGWMHEMQDLTRTDVMNFHKTWYHPNNAILILSGDITAAEAKPLAQKYYGALKKAPVPERHWSDEPPQLAERHLTLRHKNVRQPQWSRHYATSSFGYGKKDQALPLFLLSQVLGEGKTSLLYRALVVEQKLASEVETNYSGFTLGPAQFEITAIPEPGVSMDTLEKAVDAQLAKLLKDGIADTDLARAKRLLKAESVYSREGINSMARIMGWVRILNMDTDFFTRWPERIDAVSKDAIQSAAKDTLNPNQSVTALLLPEEKGAP